MMSRRIASNVAMDRETPEGILQWWLYYIKGSDTIDQGDVGELRKDLYRALRMTKKLRAACSDLVSEE